MHNADHLPATIPMKHSRPGIASFILAFITTLIVIGDVGFVLRLQNDPSAVQNFTIIDPTLTWLTVILSTAGLGLGITAVVQEKKNKLFGLVGLIFNGLFLLGIGSLYVINVFVLIKGTGR